jgi:hypothetical protein
VTEQKTVRDLLFIWIDSVMADKVMFSAIINSQLADAIGLEFRNIDNFLKILRDAVKELKEAELSTGRVSNILIEKHRGLWKFIIFKQKQTAQQS